MAKQKKSHAGFSHLTLFIGFNCNILWLFFLWWNCGLPTTPQQPLFASFLAPCTVPFKGRLLSPSVPMAAPGTNTVYLRQTYAEDVSQYVTINENTGTAPEIPFAWVEMPVHWYASEGEIHHYLIHFFTRDDTTGRQCSDLAEGWGMLSYFPPILCNLQAQIYNHRYQLFYKGFVAIHSTGVTAAATSLPHCRRLTHHLNYHRGNFLRQLPSRLSPAVLHDGATGLVLTSPPVRLTPMACLPAEQVQIRPDAGIRRREGRPFLTTTMEHHQLILRIAPVLDRLIDRYPASAPHHTFEHTLVQLRSWITQLLSLHTLTTAMDPYFEDCLQAHLQH